MSFLVSFNGQFSPYVYQVRPAHELHPQSVQGLGSFDDELKNIGEGSGEGAGNKSKSNRAIKAYGQQQKVFEDLHPRTYARDIMNAPLFTVSVDEPVSRVNEVMERMGYRHIPVIENDKLVGMMSEREMMLATNQKVIRDLMKPQVIVALDTTRIQEVAHVMLDERINALPIVNFKHELVGIITLSDILKFVIHLDN